MNAFNIATAYRLDTTSHIDADRNRVAIQGTFKAMQIMGASKETRIKVMASMKANIREHDAQSAAWFALPDRATWVHARYQRGEFEGQPPEVLGRAFTGGEVAL